MPDAPKPFDLGLVMAGAVSAGAYTAGAVDFLFQALDDWYAAKGPADVPPHDVRLRVMTGASAGAITAAIVATVLNEDLPPVADYPTQANGPRNKLYDAWVNRVDIEPLLGHVDLDQAPDRLQSFLDSTTLDRIGEAVFVKGTPRPAPRPYARDDVVVGLTVTNLRGVPYQIQFDGLGGTKMPYVMSVHADTMTFKVPGHAPAPGAVRGAAAGGADTAENALVLSGDVGTGAWPTLRQAALASGAFPIGLAPRALKRGTDVYRRRRWYFPHPTGEGPAHRCGHFGTLDPDFGADDFDYDFLCVDGGTMDNEPVGLARTLLDPDDRFGHRTAGEAPPGAILMIDPFPDAGSFTRAYDFHEKFTLLKLAPQILTALIAQARFKPEELTRAADPNVFNQFLIAPARTGGVNADKFPIACGGLGGFGGFLSRAFRAHDFQLGRRNTQLFLRRHFVLPETRSDGQPNLFAGWSAEARTNHRIYRDQAGRFVQEGATAAADAKVAAGEWQAFLPIVPLVGRSRDTEEPNPKWPKYPRKDLDKLRTQVTNRAKGVVERFIEGVQGPVTKFLLRRAWWLKRSDLIEEHVMSRVNTDLDERGLLA